MTPAPEAPAQPRLYKRSPIVWDVPQSVQEQAEHVVRWLAAEMRGHWDLDAVRIAWFEDAAAGDRLGDPGVFETERPAWGAVDPAEPRVIKLHKDNRHRPRRAFVRTVLHEGVHVGQFAQGLQARRSPAELEQMVDELLAVAFADVLAGVPQGRMG